MTESKVAMMAGEDVTEQPTQEEAQPVLARESSFITEHGKMLRDLDQVKGAMMSLAVSAKELAKVSKELNNILKEFVRVFQRRK